MSKKPFSPGVKGASVGIGAVLVGAVLWVLSGGGPYFTSMEEAPLPPAVVTEVESPTDDILDVDYGSWVPVEAPNYYLVTGDAEVGFPQVGSGEYFYEGLDEDGRTQGAAALITHEAYEEARERGRQRMPSANPSGWGHNFETVIQALGDGNDYRGHFWNRSHLIADSLGGDAAVYNLVTGTRAQNVGIPNGSGGMAYTENLAWKYFDDPTTRGCALYYAANPVYEGDELVPRTVEVDILSCDASINEHVIVFNTALGFAIDYATGEAWPVRLGEPLAGD